MSSSEQQDKVKAVWMASALGEFKSPLRHHETPGQRPGVRSFSSEWSQDGPATYDFGYVVEGEVVMQLDDGETHLAEGDLVVQNGTMHAWFNPTDRPARMLFVCIGAHFDA